MLRRVKNKKIVLLCWVFLFLATLDIEVNLPRPLNSFVVVVDVTMSMNAEDKLIGMDHASRIEFVKVKLAGVLPKLKCGTRLGLGIFAGYQTTILYEPIEVCRNYSDILKSINYLNTNVIWAGDSEVSKGLFNAMNLVGEIEKGVHLLFFSDGHEAPPVSPKYRPVFDKETPVQSGLVVGVGGNKLTPIPRIDREGRNLGFWKKEDVLQVDQFTLGRKGSDQSETLVDDDTLVVDTDIIDKIQATPGTEHLTTLRGKYLKLLAAENNLGYQDLLDADSLFSNLNDLPVSEWRSFPSNISSIFAIFALFCLVILLTPKKPMFLKERS